MTAPESGLSRHLFFHNGVTETRRKPLYLFLGANPHWTNGVQVRLLSGYEGNHYRENRASSNASHKKILRHPFQSGTGRRHLLFRSVSCDRIRPVNQEAVSPGRQWRAIGNG
jgi:hypothetical protein